MIWIFNNYKNVVRLMFISFLIYILVWLLLIMYIFDFTNLSYKDHLASMGSIIFLCLSYMQFFSMICRGFSLQIMTDIYLNNSITRIDLIKGYANGKGLDWMIEKRLNSIHRLKLINFDGKILRLIYPQGYVCAYLTIFLKKILSLKKGGE